MKKIWKKIGKTECGQAMVEFALTAVMFFTVVFAVVDIGWIGYQIVAFDYGYQHVSWNFFFEWDGSVRRKQGEAGLSDNELIRRRLISSIRMVNPNDLTVSNGKFTFYKEKFGKTFLRGDKESITKDTKMSMNIQATIEYRVRALTPLGLYFFNQNGERGIVLRKQLNRYRLLSERTE